MKTVEELIKLLTLERVDECTYVGGNYKTPWGRVFGGQVLGQSLHAAYQTVPEDRLAHSMHAYFILGGDVNEPIRYEVDTIRDGGSFTTRRVVAWQKGRAIFNMAASFQLQQPGFNHQVSVPNVLPPEVLLADIEQYAVLKDTMPALYKRRISSGRKPRNDATCSALPTCLDKNEGKNSSRFADATPNARLCF